MKHEYKIAEIQKWGDSVTPNFIFNRFDLSKGKDQNHIEILQVKSQNDCYVIEVYYNGKEATLGLWLSNIPDEPVQAAAKYIFAHHAEIKKIYFSHSLRKHGITEDHNHFRVDLPATIDEFDKMGTRKERYNVRRRLRKIHDEQGEIIYCEYRMDEEIPYDVLRRYFTDKEEGYTLQDAVPQAKDEIEDYVRQHDITNVYTMNKQDGTIIAIILSCEQCPCVYIENITFDAAYRSYFPGILLYDHYLRCLVSKHKQSLFLGGGKWEFKRRYQSKEDHVYECRIYRGALNQWIHKIGEKLKHRKEN